MSDGHIFVVDDDTGIRISLRMLLEAAHFQVYAFASATDFLTDNSPKQGCLITDVRMPDFSGLELQEEIKRRQLHLSVIIMTGFADIPLAVQAMRAGAVDFLEKPFDDASILTSVRRALDLGFRTRCQEEEPQAARELLALLTPRERSVLDKLIEGRPNKTVALELGISPRTVEVHRANIMTKMDASSLPDLVRTALMAQNG